MRIVCSVMIGLALFPSVALAQRVTNVSSGDTVVVEGVGKIRLLGVRTADGAAVRLGNYTAPLHTPTDRPPTPPLISGAVGLKRERPGRTFLQQLVLGKTVRIQYDSLTGGKERAYLFLDDGMLVNAELLRTGHARVDLSRPFGHQAEFKDLEDEARRAGIGIWVRIR